MTISMPARLAVAAVGFLLMTAAAAVPEQTTVHVEGTVRAADGTPMAGTYVSPGGLGQRIRIVTDADGRFAFDFDQPGAYFCWFAAPWHMTATVPLLIPASGRLHVDVRLQTVDYAEPFDTVSVVGDFNDFDTEQGAVAMTPRGDGTFAATIETTADSLHYQLLGVQAGEHPRTGRGYPLCGTQFDRLEFDFDRPLLQNHGGKYVAVVAARDGAAQIVFDPARLPRSGAPLDVTTDDATADGIIAADRAAHERADVAMEAHVAAQAAGNDSFQYDWAPARDRARGRIDTTDDPVVRRFRLVDFFRIPPAPEDSLLARRVVDDVPPDSPVWSLLWGGPFNTWSAIARTAGDDDRALRYAADVAAHHADADVRAAFLYYALGVAAERGDEDAQRRLYFKLTGEYPDHWLTEMASRRLAPDRAIEPGKPLPEFQLHTLHGDSAITREVLAGRVFLLDFWATWCKPCVSEMEYLHDAYDRFKDRGFTIVSVSFDRKPSHVDDFRRDEWPMPWLHAWVRPEELDALGETFEIGGIPRAILVGTDGVIVAEGPALRGGKLVPAVEAALKR